MKFLIYFDLLCLFFILLIICVLFVLSSGLRCLCVKVMGWWPIISVFGCSPWEVWLRWLMFWTLFLLSMDGEIQSSSLSNRCSYISFVLIKKELLYLLFSYFNFYCLFIFLKNSISTKSISTLFVLQFHFSCPSVAYN